MSGYWMKLPLSGNPIYGKDSDINAKKVSWSKGPTNLEGCYLGWDKSDTLYALDAEGEATEYWQSDDFQVSIGQQPRRITRRIQMKGPRMGMFIRYTAREVVKKHIDIPVGKWLTLEVEELDPTKYRLYLADRKI